MTASSSSFHLSSSPSALSASFSSSFNVGGVGEGDACVEDDDSDVELVTMKPQSLAATFDYFSDED